MTKKSPLTKQQILNLERWTSLFEKSPKLAIAHASWIGDRLVAHEEETRDRFHQYIEEIDTLSLKVERLQGALRRLRRKHRK